MVLENSTNPDVKIEELVCRHNPLLKNNARVLIITITAGDFIKSLIRPKHKYDEKSIFGDVPIFCDDKKCVCCLTYMDIFDKQRYKYYVAKNFVR